MIADGRDTDSIPIYTTMIPQQSLTKKTLFGVHTQVSYIYIYIYRERERERESERKREKAREDVYGYNISLTLSRRANLVVKIQS